MTDSSQRTGNRRTSILIEDGDQGTLRLKLTRSPRGKPGRSRSFPEPKLPDPADEATARLYGGALLTALRGERILRAALNDALRAGATEVWPLCFKVEGERAEKLELCWETLYEKSEQFLALNPRWPIGRLVETSEMPVRIFQAPLRILAVMSAAGVSARKEWLGIKAAVQFAQQQGLPVHVTAVVGEQLLFEELDAEARAARPSWLKVVALESQGTIEDLFVDPFPHILHFFCHGAAGYGTGQVSLATIVDRAETPDAVRDSVIISLSSLQKFVASRDLWLVTLNCCSGADSVGATHSLASSLVSVGAGAALGWRTPVEPADAYTLCRTVYKRLIHELIPHLVNAPANSKFPLELTTLAHAVRDELRMKYQNQPANWMRWTLPILFVATEPLGIVVTSPRPDNPDDLAKLDVSDQEGTRIRTAATQRTLQAAGAVVEDLSAELTRRTPELREFFVDPAAP